MNTYMNKELNDEVANRLEDLKWRLKECARSISMYDLEEIQDAIYDDAQLQRDIEKFKFEVKRGEVSLQVLRGRCSSRGIETMNLFVDKLEEMDLNLMKRVSEKQLKKSQKQVA